MPTELIVHTVPPLIRQVDQSSCWAAALASWLAVTPGRKKIGQDELIEEMDVDGYLDAFGGLNIKKGILRFKKRFNMSFDVFPYQKKHKLTANYLLSRLKKGHLYLVCGPQSYNVQFPVAHAVVVFAFVNEQKWKQIHYMDPWPPENYWVVMLADLVKLGREFVVGYPGL